MNRLMITIPVEQMIRGADVEQRLGVKRECALTARYDGSPHLKGGLHMTT